MMPDERDPTDEAYRVHEWHSDLERKHRKVDLSPLILERLSGWRSVPERKALRQVLQLEYQRHQRYAEAEEVLLEQIGDDPDDPMPVINLATHKLIYENNPPDAVRIGRIAADVARRAGRFRRLALGWLARAAIATDDHELLRDCLREIVEIGSPPAGPDIGRERDFFDRAPEGSIPDELRAAYEELMNRRPTPKSEQ
jgi:hypothetical protein